MNFLLLVWFLRRKLGRLDGRRVIMSLGRNCFCALLMGATVYMVSNSLALTTLRGTYLVAAQTCAGTMTGMIVYLGLSALSRILN